MKKNKLIKFVCQIIFFGAVWGIVEGTLGYILQFMPPLISGFIMFPIAAFILIKAYKSTNTRLSLIYIGLIAATIKSVDLFLPGLSIYKTINPMMAIIFESMVVAVAYPALSSRKIAKQAIGSIVVSVGWRTGFILYMIGIHLLTGLSVTYLASFNLAFNFVMINGIISGLLVMGVLWLESKTKHLIDNKWEVKPSYALITLIFAIGIQFIM